MRLNFDEFYARNGAEIICLPVWGAHQIPGTWDAVMRTRAVDNGVYLVAATYCQEGGLIVHPDGEISVCLL